MHTISTKLFRVKIISIFLATFRMQCALPTCAHVSCRSIPVRCAALTRHLRGQVILVMFRAWLVPLNYIYLTRADSPPKLQNFNDGGEVYRQQLNAITRYVKKRDADQLWPLQEKHDISHILAQIENEAAEKSKRTGKTRDQKSTFGTRLRSLMR